MRIYGIFDLELGQNNEEKFMVATQDTELLQKLEKHGNVIFQKYTIELESYP